MDQHDVWESLTLPQDAGEGTQQEPEIARNAPFTFQAIPVTQLRIDLDQPRQFLGRLRTSRATTDPRQTIADLRAAAEAGDAEGQGVLADICELADSIFKHGLNYWLHVRANPAHNAFTIIDGERRYWAFQWLIHRDLLPPTYAVMCAIHPHDMPLERIDVTQWSANTQRRDFSVADIADWVAAAFEKMQRAVTEGTHLASTSVSEEMLAQAPENAVLQMVSDQLYTLSGRRLTPRTLRLYRGLSRDLALQTKRLASAHSASLNMLIHVARVKGSDRQVRTLRVHLGLETNPHGDAKGGRPNAIERCGNAIEQTVEAFERLNDKALERLPAERISVALTRIVDAHEQLRDHVKRLHKKYRVGAGFIAKQSDELSGDSQ